MCAVFSTAASSKNAPEGFPLGADVSERVVFNGYFLKIMKYQAGDIARGAPVLVGKLGWEPDGEASPPNNAAAPAISGRLFWSLVILGILFFVSLGRFSIQLFRNFSASRARKVPTSFPAEDIPAEDLSAWVDSVSRQEEDEWEDEPG